MTNEDRIRTMTDEELAKVLDDFEACDVCEYADEESCMMPKEMTCTKRYSDEIIIRWLQSEAKGEK